MKPAPIIDFAAHLSRLDSVSPVEVKGRVKEVIGLVAKATVPEAWIGELCLIHNPRSKTPVKAEVVGFQDGDVMLMPLGDLANIGPQSEVMATRTTPDRPVGERSAGPGAERPGRADGHGDHGSAALHGRLSRLRPSARPDASQPGDQAAFDRRARHRCAADLRRRPARRIVRRGRASARARCSA